MKIWDRIKSKKKKNLTTVAEQSLFDFLGMDHTPRKSLNEATYYTCLKILSETLGKMPMKLYQDTDKGVVSANNEVFRLLRYRPNPEMTPSIFWSAIENNRNHYGNAYVWIQREFKRKKYGGSMEIKGLYPMSSENVTVLIDDAGIFGGKGKLYYEYQDPYDAKQYVFPSHDVLHFKTSSTIGGIIGKPVRQILQDTIHGGLESQRFMNNLYKSGMTARAVLEYTGELNRDLEIQLTENLERYANGANNAGKFIPVPIGMKIAPLDIKLTDSQFFELKKFTALQIAAAFGVKPNQINDYAKSSYSNSEAQQISFYVDTMLFILKHYEEELDYKLLAPEERKKGLWFKFNENAVLRTDSKTQAEILTGYVQNGIYKPNEARNLLNKPETEEGNELMCNGNFIKLRDLGLNYQKGDTNVKVKTE